MLNGRVLHKPHGKPGQYSCRQTDNIVAATRDYGGTTCHGQGRGLGREPLLAFEHKYLQICGDQQTLRRNVTPHTHHILLHNPTGQDSEPLVYAGLPLFYGYMLGCLLDHQPDKSGDPTSIQGYMAYYKQVHHVGRWSKTILSFIKQNKISRESEMRRNLDLEMPWPELWSLNGRIDWIDREQMIYLS